MADEYYNNKIVTTDGDVLMDLTQDTVTPEAVLEGETFHLRSGAPAMGTYRPSDEIEARLEATVGHSNKNLLEITAETQTINGVTFTVDKQAGTITAKGLNPNAAAVMRIRFTIPEGNYYFSGCPLGGGTLSYDIFMYDDTAGNDAKKWDGTTKSEHDYGGTSQEFKGVDGHTFAFALRIRKGYDAETQPVVFKPMIRDGSIADDTFEPYVTPTDMLIDARARAYLNSSVGHSSKNLLPITLESDEYTADGAKLSYVVDKVAGTITINGNTRASGNINLPIYEDDNGIIAGKLYISGGYSSRCQIVCYDYSAPGYVTEWDGVTQSKSTAENESKEMMPISGHRNVYRLQIGSGQSFDNVVIKPMLRDGSISDDTFEPYTTPTDARIIALEARVAALEAMIDNT